MNHQHPACFSAMASCALGVMLLVFPALPPRAGGILNQPSPQRVEEIREALHARQAERDALAGREAFIPWRQLAESPDPLAGDKRLLVRLANTMNLHRAVWTFTPAAGHAAARPVRVLQCWRGEQWIALEPGEWTATVAIGRPTGGRAIRFPIAPLAGRRGQVYELALGGEVEQSVAALERADEKKRAEVARRLQAPPAESKQKAD